MSKRVDFKMGKFLFDIASKPLRTKTELILLVLNTIKVIDARVEVEDPKGKIVLKVDRMNRLFYEVENKMFSVQFPFSIEIKKDDTFRIYDNEIDIDIDSKVISLLIRMFEKFEKIKNDDLKSITFEKFFTELYEAADESNDVEVADESKNIEVEVLWKLINRMTLFDVGYLRYDYDEKYKNGKLHPLNHLDINYESSCTYKIGLKDKIRLDQLIDVVDVVSECSFLNI